MGVVFSRVDGRELSLTKNVAVNPSRNVGELGNPIISSASGDDGEEINSLTGPLSLQKQDPSSPFWKCLESRLLRMQNHGSTMVKVIMEELDSKRGGLAAVTARLNWLIGWRVGGHLSRSSSTNSGIAARAAQSLDNSATCSEVGTSPVNKSQNRPSGNGSLPPGAFGRSC